MQSIHCQAIASSLCLMLASAIAAAAHAAETDMPMQEAALNEPLDAPPPLLLIPAEVKDGVALVDESNTALDPRAGVFLSAFRFADKPPAEAEIVLGHGEAGDLLRRWYREGTAAGHHGDLYDNRDGDHSNLDYASFPQLTRIEFNESAKRRNLHMGLQARWFFSAITIGNSSTAITAGPYWRSQPRLAYTDPRAAAMLAEQYAKNHLYFYPEHRDHDPGHNGAGEGGDGHGDVYPANTPYVIISQGSSGSDQAFMDAVACTLAAFRPEVKRLLAEQGALMPALQMVFRASNRQVVKPEDYLSGAAHPTVFDGAQLDLLKMVQLAHDIRREDVPPLVRLRVVEEDEGLPGRDYFAPGLNERLLDTPAAIARIARSTKRLRRMVVSAENSRDLNGRALKFHWVVLRGDAAATQIKPLNEAGSVVELLIPYHPRRPITPGAALESNRVDIGAVVHNGAYYSAPAFVSVFYLDGEMRKYDDQGRIVSVEYGDSAAGGNYVDPLIELGKSWRDDYRYDDAGRLIGWTRTRGESSEEFTADGALIIERDALGRATKARRVRYLPEPREGQAPRLVQQSGEDVLSYGYKSDDDRVGRVME